LYNEEQKLLVVFIIHVLARPAPVLGYCRKHATASSYVRTNWAQICNCVHVVTYFLLPKEMKWISAWLTKQSKQSMECGPSCIFM